MAPYAHGMGGCASSSFSLALSFIVSCSLSEWDAVGGATRLARFFFEAATNGTGCEEGRDWHARRWREGTGWEERSGVWVEVEEDGGGLV